MISKEELDEKLKEEIEATERIRKFLKGSKGYVTLRSIAEHLGIAEKEVKELIGKIERVSILYPFLPEFHEPQIGKLLEKDGAYKLATEADIKKESRRLANISWKLRAFFDSNPENYYTAQEIAENTRLSREDVVQELSRMALLIDYYAVECVILEGNKLYKKSR